MTSKKIPKIKSVKSISKIQSKGTTVKDPVRHPKIIVPIEKSMTDSYLKMMNTMIKMVQLELVKQTK